MKTASFSYGLKLNGKWSGIESIVFPRLELWIVLLAVCLVNFLWVSQSAQFSIAPRLLLYSAAVLAASLALVTVRLTRSASFDRYLDGMFRFAAFVLFCALMKAHLGIFNQLVMSIHFPLVDEYLLSWDQALGFDWNSYASLIAERQWSRIYFAIMYSEVGFKAIGIMAVAMIAFGHRDRLDELSYLLLISGLACIAVAPFFPAEAAWKTVASPEIKAMLGQEYGGEWRVHFQTIRSGLPFDIGEEPLMGLVTFPSFHTCSGLIIVWCSRGHPLTLAAGAVVGLSMIAATPVFGGHYLIDLLGGTAIILVLVLVWHRPWKHPGTPAEPPGTLGQG